MDIIKQSNESTRSSLSFLSARNSIGNEKVGKQEIESSLIAPRIVKKDMASNVRCHESSTKCGFTGILRPKNWPNPFVQGR